MGRAAVIEDVRVAAYTVPTDYPEADGTIAWDGTTIVVTHVAAGGRVGIGYSYADRSAAGLAAGMLAGAIRGGDALGVGARWADMVRSVRNIGRPGIAAGAISALDSALWDLKAKLLGLPLVTLLGQVRDRVPVYGSGGFTSYPPDRLAAQLGGWAASGIAAVKMKVGSRPEEDLARVRLARDAIGAATALFVDANGAYDRKQALAKAEAFDGLGVTWFEEPVSSDDLDGLRLLRDRAPAAMEIAAGEYGYDAGYFRRMLAAGAVDVLQADATRCLGLTGFISAATLCAAFHVPLSAHTAPALHTHVGCALSPVRHLEYFHDHVRIEAMLLDGAPQPESGALAPDLSRPGLGFELREADARRYEA